MHITGLGQGRWTSLPSSGREWKRRPINQFQYFQWLKVTQSDLRRLGSNQNTFGSEGWFWAGAWVRDNLQKWSLLYWGRGWGPESWCDLARIVHETAGDLQGLTSETGDIGPVASPCLRLGRNSPGLLHLRRRSHCCLGQTDKGVPTGTTCLSALVPPGSCKSSHLSQKSQKASSALGWGTHPVCQPWAKPAHPQTAPLLSPSLRRTWGEIPTGK